MNCPKCRLEQNDENRECLRCGLIFSRYKPLDYDRILKRQSSHKTEKRSPLKRIIDYMFHTKDKIEIVYFVGRMIVFVFLFIWSIKFFQSSIESNYVGRSFMHLVNLPFHEAGHIVFRPLGRVMHSLGGSLGQVIMPLICTLVLLIKTRDTFGASIGLWWMGESILDMAPYINDARSLSLQLLGGNTGVSAPYGFHDWNFILTELNLLRHDHLIAGMAATGGKLIMSISLLWGLILMIRQFSRLASSG
ncbi:MAG: zinc ribbon domain-containing protein [Candidatus Aegiribacteria sp.]|nr:zinc ribbon domain-containing protein [Candidatus Aegiribacteria sp.]